jgi:exodeoxyribonuclease VIII
METGFIKGLSSEAYHSGPGVSKSDLALILRSPAHYKAKEEGKETPALLFGQAFHEFVLEPKSFDKDWRVTTKKTISKGMLPEDAITKIKVMQQAILANETAHDLLSGDIEPELSFFWMDPIYSEIPCKARADVLNKSKQIVVDIKTCVEATESAITRDAYKYHWDMQSGFYTYGLQLLTGVEHDFYFIAVEKESPFCVSVFKSSPDFIQHGMIKCQQALEVYSECLKKNEWPGYSQEIISLELPGWVKRKNMMDDAIIE